MTSEPTWVEEQREARRLAQLKHVPGQKMTRCTTCWNYENYCTCPKEKDAPKDA